MTKPINWRESGGGRSKSDLPPMARTYTLVYCHLETLSSSLSPCSHLTQLAATTAQGQLFRPILPPDLTKYLDGCKLGGDLLLNLNMTRDENGDSFLFRRRFEAITAQTERVECVSEEEALGDLLTFLETAGLNIILVCVNEDTVSVLMGKLKALDRGRVWRMLSGFTWWRRSLKYLSVHGYRHLELESFHQATFPSCPLPSLPTALVVASMLNTCVTHMARQSPGSCLGLTAVPAMFKAKARQRQVEEGREMLEIYNSFRPDTSTFITVDKLEQVEIVSDSEEETVKTAVVKEPELVTISSDSECEEPPVQGPTERRPPATGCQHFPVPLVSPVPPSSVSPVPPSSVSPVPPSSVSPVPPSSVSPISPRLPSSVSKRLSRHTVPHLTSGTMRIPGPEVSIATSLPPSGLVHPPNIVHGLLATPNFSSMYTLLHPTITSPGRAQEKKRKKREKKKSKAGVLCQVPQPSPQKNNFCLRNISKLYDENSGEDIAAKGPPNKKVKKNKQKEKNNEKTCDETSEKNPLELMVFWNGQRQRVACPICTRVVMKMINVEKHMLKVHHKLKHWIICCKDCGARDISPDKVAMHSQCKEPQTENSQNKQGMKVMKVNRDKNVREKAITKYANTTRFWELLNNGMVVCPFCPPIHNTKMKVSGMNKHMKKIHFGIQNIIQKSYCRSSDWLISDCGHLRCPYHPCTAVLPPGLMEGHLARQHPNFMISKVALYCPEDSCTEVLTGSQVAGHMAGHSHSWSSAPGNKEGEGKESKRHKDED